MVAVACPNCGNALIFSSPALPVQVCDRCRSLVLNRSDGLERVGEAAALPFDVSPLQLGSTGCYDGGVFRVAGRVRWAWVHGSWNEWLVLFDDGSQGWLAEAMGDFMILRERDLDQQKDGLRAQIESGEPDAIGDMVIIDETPLIVVDIKTATPLASEGELPFKAARDWSITSIDLRSTTSLCASIQRDAEGPSLYTGRTVTLRELAMSNLRALAGWKLPA